MLPDVHLLAASDTIGRLDVLAERMHGLWGQPLPGIMLRLLFILAPGAVGLFLMLPRGQARCRSWERYVGAALATLTLVLLATAPLSPRHLRSAAGDEQAATLANSEGSQATVFWSLDGQPLLACSTFHVLAAVSLISAVMMVTSRNPVYSALWFAMVLLANSGLYLMQAAEFLSAATIIVYAGAVVVTFLFVIMLAQPSGAARYDRVSREPLLTSITGLILAASLVGALHYSARAELRGGDPVGSVLPSHELIAAGEELTGDVAIDYELHVASLGRALFVDHVVSVEVVGVLLLAAVVGAMLIAGHQLETAREERLE